MKLIKEWRLPIDTTSELNSREHWHKKSKRHSSQKSSIAWQYRIDNLDINLPCIVEMIRLSPRQLDSDNLQGAFKWIRDAIAECLIPGKSAGQADNDPRIQWRYGQEKSKDKGILVKFYQ